MQVPVPVTHTLEATINAKVQRNINGISIQPFLVNGRALKPKMFCKIRIKIYSERFSGEGVCLLGKLLVFLYYLTLLLLLGCAGP